MAAAKRGSCDATISKMLFLHLPSRFPPLLPELELSSLVQSAALLGVGLLYQGSCHRQGLPLLAPWLISLHLKEKKAQSRLSRLQPYFNAPVGPAARILRIKATTQMLCPISQFFQ